MNRASLSPRAFWFMSAVVAIQGGHVVEHVIQLFQVYAFGVPEEMRSACWATHQFNGTEMAPPGLQHVLPIGLYALVVPCRDHPRRRADRRHSLFTFASVCGDLAHGRAQRDHLAHNLAPAGVPARDRQPAQASATILHFFYNTIAYAGVALASRVMCCAIAAIRGAGPAAGFQRGSRGTRRRDATSAIEFACLADRDSAAPDRWSRLRLPAPRARCRHHSRSTAPPREGSTPAGSAVSTCDLNRSLHHP